MQKEAELFDYIRKTLKLVRRFKIDSPQATIIEICRELNGRLWDLPEEIAESKAANFINLIDSETEYPSNLSYSSIENNRGGIFEAFCEIDDWLIT